ncbi:MAG: hypothetical protein LBC79_02450 [Deltaproteobacteria bacterium]|jgi:Ca2+-binding RTX toxin-like protein|nr:hypothetical protein [Deltaproteobacteria bacterium]
MTENTKLARPAAGETVSVSVGSGARLEFAFDQSKANLGKDGKDFVLTFDDGAVLRLQGFYDNFGENANPPTLIVEGNELPGEAFLAALNNPDLMPAAGPAAPPPPLIGGGGWGGDAMLNGAVMLTVSAHFDVADGFDQHIILFEAKEGWIIEVPDGYALLPANYVLDGLAYCQIAVNDMADGNPTLTVILTPETPTIGTGGMDIKVGGLSLYANGNAAVVISEEPLAVAWNNTAQLVLHEGTMEGVAGEVDLQFRLSLQNGNQTLSVATAIVLNFVVTSDTGNLRVPDRWMNTETTDGRGNTLCWSKDAATGNYILTATWAPEQSELDVAFEAFHMGAQNGIIDPDLTLRLTLKSVSTLDSAGYPVWPDGLDHAVNAGDPDHPFTVGDQLAFTVVDADYAQVAAYGIGHEADGMTLAHVDASGVYDGSHLEHGQVIMGADGDDTIYATQGNDILIGGSGHDTYVWNNVNMGHGDDARDVIKDFDMHNDTLRFDDLFGTLSGDAAGHALESLLHSSAQWDTQNLSFSATDGNASIQLNVMDTVATLKVSYASQSEEYGSTQYTQTVELQGFNAADHFGGTADAAEVAKMLQDIIKVGGA